MPSLPLTLLAALWAAVMGIKRAKSTIKKVSFYLLTKKVHSYKGQLAESVLWQGGYNNNIWPTAFTAGKKITKYLILKKSF